MLPANMGKRKREMRIARREYEAALNTPRKFSWKKYFQVLGRTLPKVLLVFVATLALQFLLVSLGVQFFSTMWGQLLLFIPAYILTLTWTRQTAKDLYVQDLPVKPEILKKR
jgi:putative copper export protein